MKIVKRVLIKVKENILGFVVGVVLAGSITVAFATGLLSSGVTYDNTDSGLSSTTVQGALDELNEMAESSGGGAYVYSYPFLDSFVYYMTDPSLINSSYSSFAAMSRETRRNIGLKYKIENNMITEAYACGLWNGQEFCLLGNSMYAVKKVAMEAFFTGSNGSCDKCDSDYCYCSGGRLYAEAYSDGGVSVSDDYSACDVYADGEVICH